MPKRTNNFQKIVFLVKKHVSDGAMVTESKYLKDSITGTDREVDICIESSVAGHQITVSIECMDHNRKATVKWVEEMKAKHERLATDKLVLVSSSGFSEEATAIARTYRIETVALSDLDDNSAEKLFGSTNSLWIKVFTMRPTKVVIRVKTIGHLSAENVVSFPDNLIYDHQGNELFNVKMLVEYLLHTEYIVQKYIQIGNESHKGFEVRWEPVSDSNSTPLCLKRLEPILLRPIEYVKITGSCSFELSKFPLKNGELGGVRVAWATGEFLGKEALSVASKNQLNETKISITNKNITLKSTG